MTISYAVSPVQVTLVGSVTGTATNGTCTNDPLTGGGSCVVTAGVGSVTLTASPLPLSGVRRMERHGLHQRHQPAGARQSDLEHHLHGDVLAHLSRQDCASYDASSSSTVRTRPRAARLSALR